MKHKCPIYFSIFKFKFVFFTVHVSDSIAIGMIKRGLKFNILLTKVMFRNNDIKNICLYSYNDVRVYTMYVCHICNDNI